MTKLIANRIKPLLDKIISQNQSAFILNRKITDNIVVAHEIVHTMKTSKIKNGRMALKSDLSKAFDRLERDFVIFVFKFFCFSSDFCDLIYHCMSTVSVYVLVNGLPGETFFPTRGIRQGDPMSPYIFIICMEALSKLLYHAETNGKISGIKVTRNCPYVSHLFFADDSFLFTSATIVQARNLLDTLKIFSGSSGQVINYQKSGIYFSKKVENKHCKLLARILKVGRITQNNTYLGTLLFFSRYKSFNYQNLLDRVYNRVQGWKAKFLSQAGRTTLICSVTSAMPMYQMMCFLIPKKTSDKLDALQRDFWWQKSKSNRGLYIKAWDFICSSKSKGGLGIMSPYKFNLALLTRLAWRLIENPDKLWCIILKHKYFPNSEPLKYKKKSVKSWVWTSICKGLDIIRENHCWQLGNGNDIEIWFDKWLPEGEIPKPRNSNNTQLVSKVSYLIDGQGNWNLNLIHNVFDNDTVESIKLLEPVCDSTRKNTLKWISTKDGVVSVKSAYNFLCNRNNVTLPVEWKGIWNLSIMPIVKIFLWKTLSECLPVREILGKHTYSY